MTTDNQWTADDNNKVDNGKQNPHWEQQVIEKMVLASVTEQRRARRWGIFFKSVFFLFALFVIIMLSSGGRDSATGGITETHVAVIDVQGIIDAERSANAKDIIESLDEAFKEPKATGIILNINSPGGSAVQAGLVYDEIMRLRKENPEKKVYSVISDSGASGAYYIAAASNEIYANRASLVGSIGVLMDGFGFVDTMKKIGVERRLFTAGEHKGWLDPFSPEKPEDVAFLKDLLDTIHTQFIDSVREGRGDRLKENPEIFSGLAWSGEQAVGLGLIDGLGSMNSVASHFFNTDNLVDYSHKETFFERLSGEFPKAIANELVGNIEHESRVMMIAP